MATAETAAQTFRFELGLKQARRFAAEKVHRCPLKVGVLIWDNCELNCVVISEPGEI